MREQPPEAGMSPMLASGKPMRAERPMIRKSDAMQISSPSPTAVPLMAEITGLGSVSSASRSALVANWKYIGGSSACLANCSSKLGHVGPGREGLVALAGEDDGPDLRVGGDLGHGVSDLVEHGDREPGSSAAG